MVGAWRLGAWGVGGEVGGNVREEEELLVCLHCRRVFLLVVTQCVRRPVFPRLEEEDR